MECQIPAFVDNMMVSDVDDDRFSNLTLDDAKVKLRQLSSANNQLKVTLQQSLRSMDNTCNLLTAFKESEKQKEKERCEKARLVIQSLKQSNEEKDKIINDLQQQMKQSASGATSAVGQNILLEYQQRTIMCKQQVIQLEEQLRASEQEKAKMYEGLLLAEKEKMTQKKEFEGKLDDLQAEIKSEKEKSLARHNDLTQMTFRYEQLMIEYTTLLNASSQRSYRETELLDFKKDYEQRIDNLTVQLIMAEETLKVLNNQILALKQQNAELMSQLKQKDEEVEVWKCQVTVYRSDFDAERKSREELNDKRLELLEENDRLKAQIAARGGAPVDNSVVLNQLGQGISRTVIAEETGQADVNRGAVGGALARIGPEAFPNQQHAPPDVNRFPHGLINLEQVPTQEHMFLPNRRNPTTPVVQQVVQNLLLTPVTPVNAWPPLEEEQQEVEFKCPLCGLIAPDADSLTLHCNDCIK